MVEAWCVIVCTQGLDCLIRNATNHREELAAKGGWQVKGYPMCLDPAMAKYI